VHLEISIRPTYAVTAVTWIIKAGDMVGKVTLNRIAEYSTFKCRKGGKAPYTLFQIAESGEYLVRIDGNWINTTTKGTVATDLYFKVNDYKGAKCFTPTIVLSKYYYYTKEALVLALNPVGGNNGQGFLKAVITHYETEVAPLLAN
jgi:hypothetical protein